MTPGHRTRKARVGHPGNCFGELLLPVAGDRGLCVRDSELQPQA